MPSHRSHRTRSRSSSRDRQRYRQDDLSTRDNRRDNYSRRDSDRRNSHDHLRYENRKASHRDDRDVHSSASSYRYRQSNRDDDIHGGNRSYDRVRDEKSDTNDRYNSSKSATQNPPVASAANTAKEKPKQKSGIFQYLSGIVPPPQRDEEAGSKEATSSTSLTVNSNALKRVIENDKRSGDRYDRKRLEGASRLLSSVNRNEPGEPLHLKTVSTMTLNGSLVRDGYSQGVKPDIAATKSLPYVCDRCEENQALNDQPNAGMSSFLTATQLSDHLKQKHGVIRHPSHIKPTNHKAPSKRLMEDGDVLGELNED